MHSEALYAERCLKAGAKGYIMKADAPEMIIQAIRKITEGDYFLSNVISNKIIGRVMKGRADSFGMNMDCLSNRELEILELIGKGYNSK